MARKALVGAAVALVAWLGAVASARACSRIAVPLDDPHALLADADAAFVGTLTTVRPLQPPTAGGGGLAPAPSVLTFSVEESVKGALPDPLELVAFAGGASCGIDATVGRRVALLLKRQDDPVTPWLLVEVSPDTLHLGLQPLPAPQRGTAAYLIGGRFGEVRSALVDQAGRPVAYGFGKGSVVAIAVCPRGEAAAELVQRDGALWVAIRRLPTLEPVGERQVTTGAPVFGSESITCRDARGDAVLVAWARRSGEASETLLVRSAPAGTTPLERAPQLAAAFRGRTAYLSLLDGRVIARDLVSGVRRRLAVLPAMMTGLSVSPDGRFVAGLIKTQVALVDVVAGTVRTRAVSGDVATTGWLGTHTLAVANYRSQFPPRSSLDVFDLALRSRAHVSWLLGLTRFVAGRAVGTDPEGGLWTSTANGSVIRVAQLFTPAVRALAPLGTYEAAARPVSTAGP